LGPPLRSCRVGASSVLKSGPAERRSSPPRVIDLGRPCLTSTDGMANTEAELEYARGYLPMWAGPPLEGGICARLLVNKHGRLITTIDFDQAKVLKVLYTITLYGKYSRALTSQTLASAPSFRWDGPPTRSRTRWTTRQSRGSMPSSSTTSAYKQKF